MIVSHIQPEYPFFTALDQPGVAALLPDRFTMFETDVHQLCLLAASDLQQHLRDQREWHHNFGLATDSTGSVIGKMFGVLVVETKHNDVGYLAAFSGKLAGGNHHTRFVPPVFDGLTQNSFVNNGMEALTRMNDEIRMLTEDGGESAIIRNLKAIRRSHSSALQQEIFDNYYFLNRALELKSLTDIFKGAVNRRPPSGAGECAAPKLLQYAFQQGMRPLALAEFWWGQSPKSDYWKHGQFYPCCKEKCEPILKHMLKGIDYPNSGV